MKPSKRLDPIHPGEILLEEFMKPLEIALTSWLAIWTFRPTASARLSMALAPSPPIPHCGWEHTSEFRRRPGSGCRSIMTFASFGSATAIGLSVAFAHGQPPDRR